MPRLSESPQRRRQHRIDVLVGLNIRKRRQLRGVTQAALADRLGISFQQLQKYEVAKNRVSAGVLHMIAQELGALPSYFFIDDRP